MVHIGQQLDNMTDSTRGVLTVVAVVSVTFLFGLFDVFDFMWTEAMFAVFFAVAYLIYKRTHGVPQKGKFVSKPMDTFPDDSSRPDDVAGSRQPRVKKIGSSVPEKFLNAAIDKIRAGGQPDLNQSLVTALMEACLLQNDADLASRVSELSDSTGVRFNVSAYDSLLKLYSTHGNAQASKRFKEMQQASLRISDGLCVALLSRCATSKFLSFAEDVVAYLRASSRMTLATYSALMNVYASCEMYQKACSLYDELLADNLKPDSVMYGCLIKFAVEGSREDLLPRLCNDMPHLELHSYMPLMKVCAQTKDVDTAFKLMDKLLSAETAPDTMAYNVLLDVCAAAGAMNRAHEVVKSMAKEIKDEITYNILVKGYASTGNTAKVWDVLREMDEEGCAPSTTAYNCLLNMSSVTANEAKVWQTVEKMDARGIRKDNYTFATLMKSLKHASNPVDTLAYILTMLDSSDINICEDEVLFITVLEACIKHRLLDRVRQIISLCERSASTKYMSVVHSYGVLIKAYGLMHRVEKCWSLWSDMFERRQMQPSSIVVACMLDALVCNANTEDAVTLFHELVRNYKIQPNAVMYSTLIKGFTGKEESNRSFELFEEMRAAKVAPSTATYNSVINALARKGDVDRVLSLMTAMQEDGCEADGTTHATVLKCYCVQGLMDEAVQLFYGIAASSDSSTCTSAYNTIIDGCIRASRLDLSDKLVRDMEKSGIKPTNFTLGTHIKHYDHAKRIDEAIKIVETWPAKYGIKPNVAVKTSLVRACIRHNFKDYGFKLFDQLASEGHNLDAKAWRSLVISCIQGDRLDEALALVEEAYKLQLMDVAAVQRRQSIGNLTVVGGERLDTEVVEGLLRQLCRSGSKEHLAQPLIDQLRWAGVRISFEFPQVRAQAGRAGGQGQYNRRRQ